MAGRMFQFAVLVPTAVTQKRIVQTGGDRSGRSFKCLAVDVERLIAVSATQSMLIDYCTKLREVTAVFRTIGVKVFS